MWTLGMEQGQTETDGDGSQVDGDQIATFPECQTLEVADFSVFMQQRDLMVAGVTVTPAGVSGRAVLAGGLSTSPWLTGLAHGLCPFCFPSPPRAPSPGLDLMKCFPF